MTLIQSDYRLEVKAESSKADLGVDMSSGTSWLTLVNGVPSLRPTKLIEDIQSNRAHPFPHRVALGRNNVGSIPTYIDKSTREIIMQMIFGGLSSGVPARNTSYAIRERKGTVSGDLFVGSMVNSTTLSATAGGIVAPSLDIIAMNEQKVSAPTIALPTTLEQPYKFAMSVAILNGSMASSVRDISLQIPNNLSVGPHRTSSLQISYLEYGTQDATGSVTLLYESEAYNDLVRGTATGSVFLLFGDAVAVHDGTSWNTDDYFTAAENVVTWDASGSALATDTVASVGPLALTTLASPADGDYAIQNPILVKLNALEFPDCPENIGDGGTVTQEVQFQVTAPTSGSVNPVEVFIDAVS